MSICSNSKLKSNDLNSLRKELNIIRRAICFGGSGGSSDTTELNRITSSATLAADEAGTQIDSNSSSPVSIRVPLNATVLIPIGATFFVSQYGTGATTIVASPGVTIRSIDGNLRLSGQYATGKLVKIGEDEWYFFSNDAIASFSPSYANSGGTGDRTAIITVTSDVSFGSDGTVAFLVNGILVESHLYFNVQSPVGKYLRFDFLTGASKIITEAKFYQQDGTTQGVWKWQGSNNATVWTDIGANFTLGGAPQTITTLSANVLGWRYYQIVNVSGTTSDGPYIDEFEFKIDDYPQ